MFYIILGITGLATCVVLLVVSLAEIISSTKE
jgi:hypothetical protein